MIRTVSVILFIVLCLVFSLNIQAEELPIETSIVSLVFKDERDVVGKDPLFELIDCEHYVLVPLNRLSAKLAYDLNYRRSDGRMVVRSLHSGKTVELDINAKTYMIDNSFNWANQPPIIMENELYVSTKLLEYISDVHITWDEKYQELIITAAWFKRDQPEPVNSDGTDTHDPGDDQPILEGPSFSVGAIRYNFGSEYRDDPETGDQLDLLGTIRSDGRAGPWTWSLAVDWDTGDYHDDIFSNGISLIRAKYNENNHRIILGDSDLYFERFFSTQWDVRGVLYMYPNTQPFRKELAFTSVSGPAEAGDIVSLIVNGRSIGKVEVEKDTYLFSRVPLRAKRSNVIKIIIEKRSGEKLVSERYIVGSPRVYEAGTHEIMATVGQFRRSTELKYGDMIGGVKVHQSFSENFSANIELAGLRMDDEDEIIYNGDIGLAYRFGSNLVGSLDWLASGAQPIHQGYEASLMYCFNAGYVEGKKFSLHPSFYDWLQTSYNDNEDVYAVSGDGWEIESEYELSERWKLGFTGIISDALPDTDEPSYQDYWLKATRYFGEHMEDSLVTKVRKKDLSGIDYVGMPYTQDLQALSVEYKYYGDDLSGSIYGLYSNAITQPQTEPDFKTNVLLTELSCIKMFGKDIIYDADLVARRDWQDRTEFQSYHLETGIKWIRDNTWYSGYLKVKADDTGGAMSLSESEAGVGVRWTLADGYSYWGVEASSIQMAYIDDTYFSGVVNALYRLNQSDSYLKGHIEYISPVGNRDTPQLEMEVGVEYFFNSGLGLEASFERIYDSIYDHEPDMVFRVMVDQSFLFARNRRRTTRYSEDDDIATVFGCVYLDENGNGRYDLGEKRIPGIKMMLNERRWSTDKEGNFIFVNVDSGVYQLGFDMRSLSADYTPVTENILVRVRENENISFDFGVTINGTISGKVLIDLNANGQLDAADQPLSWVGLALDGGTKAFTDSRGEFIFEKVPLGPHKLHVLTETVPSGMQLVGVSTYDLNLTEESFDHNDLVFLVRYKFIE